MNFLIIGDYGTSDIHQKKVAESMINLIKEHKVKFICGLGDNIYDFGVKSVNDNKFITHFEEPYKDIKLRFYQCLGNHDYGKILFNHIIPDDFKYQIEYTKLSKKWYLPKRYYHYSKNINGVKVNFFVLDTNIDLMNTNQMDEQLEFFKEKISKAKGDWNILYGHHTYRSVSGHGNAEPLLENFLNALFSLNKIQIYMCGHDHTKQHIIKNDKNPLHILVSGTGGKPYDYVTNLNNMKDCSLNFMSKNLGVGLLKCKKRSINIEFFDEKSVKEYKYSIKK